MGCSLSARKEEKQGQYEQEEPFHAAKLQKLFVMGKYFPQKLQTSQNNGFPP